MGATAASAPGVPFSAFLMVAWRHGIACALLYVLRNADACAAFGNMKIVFCARAPVELSVKSGESVLYFLFLSEAFSMALHSARPVFELL